MIKLLPSYVGSKSYWIPHLRFLEGEYIAELFCGSAIISFIYAQKAILNDKDPFLYKILNNYANLEVPEIFTQEDYFKVRSLPDWWKYAFCLQKMSFSGVFRYSKNGYNVPIKKHIKQVELKNDYEASKNRFKQLQPIVYNKDYLDVKIESINDCVIVLDPPYEGSQTSFNGKMDYHLYWEFVQQIENKVKCLIIFDNSKNMPFDGYKTRKMRVNGKYEGGEESMFIFKESQKMGKIGEQKFLQGMSSYVKQEDGRLCDFTLVNSGEKIELKSDYYDMDKSPNFFMERFSDKLSKKNGGPWQAKEHGCKYYVYFFVKNMKVFWFKTDELVQVLDNITKNEKLIDIVNQEWVTSGYKIQRDLLKNIAIESELVCPSF